MSERPLLSIIVPVYKSEQYLERCVNSILNQTYPNIEIILIDDGSPDNAGKLCDCLKEQHNNIHVIHKENGGQSSARNRGLDEAHGELIGFVDSDDWIEPEMYETLYRRLVDENADISCCGMSCIRGEEYSFMLYPDSSYSVTCSGREAVCELNKLEPSPFLNSLCNKLFKSDIFNNLRMPEGMICEDYLVAPYYLIRAKTVTCICTPFYSYKDSENSTTRSEYSTRLYDYILTSRQLLKFYEEYCPEGLQNFWTIYVAKCQDMIYRSYGKKEWDEYRKDIVNELSCAIPEKIKTKLPRGMKVKLSLLKTSVPAFAVLTGAYRTVKKLMNKEYALRDSKNGF